MWSVVFALVILLLILIITYLALHPVGCRCGSCTKPMPPQAMAAPKVVPLAASPDPAAVLSATSEHLTTTQMEGVTRGLNMSNSEDYLQAMLTLHDAEHMDLANLEK